MSSQLQTPSGFRALRKEKKGLDWTALLAVAFGVFYGCCWLALRQDAPVVPKPPQEKVLRAASIAVEQALPPEALAWLRTHPEAQIQCASPGWGDGNQKHPVAGWVLIQDGHAYPWHDQETPCPRAQTGAARWLGRWNPQQKGLELLSDQPSASFAAVPEHSSASDQPQTHEGAEQLAKALNAGVAALRQQDASNEQLDGWKERFVQKTAQSAAARLEGEAPRPADPALQMRPSGTSQALTR